MMALSRGIRGGPGGFPRAVAAALVTVVFAAIWAGPLASASAATQPPAASSSPAPVKFYVVPPPENGHADSLFTIAAQTLGDGSRFMEIFSLNEGRLQPNGGRLTKPQLIEPGWILVLPADAVGPGVRSGPLPVATAVAPHRSSPPGSAGTVIMISGALLAFLMAGMALRPIRRRAGPAVGWGPAHAEAPGPRATGRTGSSSTPRLIRSGRPRQFRAMRLAVFAMTVPILFGLIAATTQLAMYGYGSFVFRSAGTGATQQGPSGPSPSQASSQASAAHHDPTGARPGRLAASTSSPGSG